MEEKRLERIEVMLAEVINIAVNTNSILEEIRDKVNVLEEKFERMGRKV